MSRVNGKAPPVFVCHVKPATLKDCFQVISPIDIEVGTGVIVRLKSGQKVSGVLTNHCDWLVGCAVVTTEDGESIGIGYYGDIISLADSVTGEHK